LNSKIIILASDNDYIQLCSEPPLPDEPAFQIKPQVCLINMKGDLVVSKYNNPLQALISKILLGDTSDNIPDCKINKSVFPMIFPKASSTSITYSKCNKSIVEKLLNNPEAYQIILELFERNRSLFKYHFTNNTSVKLDELNDTITQNGIFSKSQLIVDFEAIPFSITTEIHQQIKDAILGA